eukprot:951733_1
MHSLLLFLFCFTNVLSSRNQTNQSSFAHTPQETQRLTFSYLPHHQYSVRLLSRRTQSLFDGLHATTKQWIQLKTFLFDLRTNETSFDTDSFESQLSQKCAFLKPFQSNYTQDQIIKIEKLLSILIDNEKIQPAKVKRAVAKTFHDLLFGTQHNSMPYNISNFLFDPIRVMMLIAFDVHNFNHLQILWSSANLEMNETGKMDNRYTLAALGAVRWHTREIRHSSERKAESIADLLWENVPLSFVHYYFSLDKLLWYRTKDGKDRRNWITLIITNAFNRYPNCGVLDTQHLHLFCLGNSVLWDLETIISRVAWLRKMDQFYYVTKKGYCWEKMKTLIEWILEHKITESNAPHFACVLIKYEFLSVPGSDSNCVKLCKKRIGLDELRSMVQDNQPIANIPRPKEDRDTCSCCAVM